MALKTVSFSVPIGTDREILSALLGIFDKFSLEPSSFQVNWLDDSRVLQDNQQIRNALNDDPVIAEICSQNNSFFTLFQLRDARGTTVTVHDVPENAFFRKTTVDAGNETNVVRFAAIVAEARAQLHAIHKEGSFVGWDGRAVEGFIQRSATELAELKTAYAAFATTVRDLEVRRQQDLLEESRRLETTYVERSTKLQEEYDRKLAALNDKEKDLAARQKAVDDRDSRHVRRELREKLKSVLAQRSEKFQLTTGTRKKRWPVTAVLLVLFALFGIGSVTMFWQWLDFVKSNPDTLTLVIFAAKQIALTFGFLASAVFLVRWHRDWFREHAAEEFRLKRMELDVDRASWVVETVLEWQEIAKSPLPDLLLDRLTENLFKDESRTTEPVRPADELASVLLGSAASARLVTPEGSELAFDKKGINSLDRPLHKSDRSR